MAMWIVAGMLVAAAFGLPILPVLVIGAFGMSALAFVLTRDGRIARAGIGFAIVVASNLMGRVLLSQPDALPIPTWASWLVSDGLLGGFSVCVILWTMYLGMFGPSRDLPLTLDGLIKMIKDHEKSCRAPDNKR